MYGTISELGQWIFSHSSNTRWHWCSSTTERKKRKERECQPTLQTIKVSHWWWYQ